ncbi:MAG: MlaD family protein [Lautropia sp.]|nr:MlaD family protein [Lautropia sp.]
MSSDNKDKPGTPDGTPYLAGQQRDRSLTPVAEAEVTERRYRWIPSMVWLLPLLAGLIGAVLTYRELTQYGPTIQVSFSSAEGLEAGKTKLRFKDVEIGMVKRIRLAEDRSHVIVSIQLDKNATGFQAKDTRYWVVRPRADISGVSGLSTLLSGAYIGADVGSATEHISAFKGLDAPPPVRYDEAGSQFTLRANEVGSMDIGSPVLFRQIPVGRVTGYSLDDDGKGVNIGIFISRPYDRFVGSNTRFWVASGVNARLDASGIKLHVDSLVSVMAGGVAFANPEEGQGSKAEEGAVFRLSRDQDTALAAPDGQSHIVVLRFDQSLRGLQPGASVNFRGVELGQVKAIDINYDEASGDFSMPVLVELFPGRLNSKLDLEGLPKTGDKRLNKVSPLGTLEEDAAQIQRLVDRGLRAQLRTGNLLTGQLYVALDFFPKAEKMAVSQYGQWLELPTVPNSLDEFQSQVSTLLTKINKIPFEQIGEDVRQTIRDVRRNLAEFERLMKSVNTEMRPEMLRTIQGLRRTLDSADRMLANDSPTQQDLRKTLESVSKAADSVRRLTDYLERHPEALLRGKQGEKG